MLCGDLNGKEVHRRRYVYTYGWFILLYKGIQHWKATISNKNLFEKTQTEISLMFTLSQLYSPPLFFETILSFQTVYLNLFHVNKLFCLQCLSLFSKCIPWITSQIQIMSLPPLCTPTRFLERCSDFMCVCVCVCVCVWNPALYPGTKNLQSCLDEN